MVRRARDAAGEPCERLLTRTTPPPAVLACMMRSNGERNVRRRSPGDIEPHDVAVAGRAFDSPAPPASRRHLPGEEGDSALFCHLALVTDWRNSNRRGRILRISAHEAVEVANGCGRSSLDQLGVFGGDCSGDRRAQ